MSLRVVVDSTQTQMWNILKDRSNNEEGRTVRISYHAVHSLPIHKHRATDIVKSWDNRGLVNSTQNGARAALTETGATVDELEQVI